MTQNDLVSAEGNQSILAWFSFWTFVMVANPSINLCVVQVSVVLQGQDDIRGEEEEQLPERTR